MSEDQEWATREEIDTIRARRVDDVARNIMRTGIMLTHRDADALGDDGLDWIRQRLGLSVTETERGTVCQPV